VGCQQGVNVPTVGAIAKLGHPIGASGACRVRWVTLLHEMLRRECEGKGLAHAVHRRGGQGSALALERAANRLALLVVLAYCGGGVRRSWVSGKQLSMPHPWNGGR